MTLEYSYYYGYIHTIIKITCYKCISLRVPISIRVSIRESASIIIVPEASVKNCSLRAFLSSRDQLSSMNPTMNKVIDFRTAESRLIQSKAEKTLSLKAKNRDCSVEKRCLAGNTWDIPAPIDGTGHTERPADNVKEALTPIYKIALAINATKEERRVFNDYQNTVKEAGWSVVSVPVSNIETSAFVVVPDTQEGKVRAAAYIAESMLDRVLGGASRERK